jgi:hypothetical protein
MPNWKTQLNSKTRPSLYSCGAAIFAAMVLAAACTETSLAPALGSGDASGDSSVPAVDADELREDAISDAGSVVDASKADALVTDAQDAQDAALATCMGTTVKLQINGKTVAFERAQFGMLASGGKHIEMHLGGKAACPSQNSPTPDYTLILTEINATQAGDQMVRAAFFDFKGDVLRGAPFVAFRALLSATFSGSGASETGCVNVKNVSVQPDAGVATVSGGSSLERCISLDD